MVQKKRFSNPSWREQRNRSAGLCVKQTQVAPGQVRPTYFNRVKSVHPAIVVQCRIYSNCRVYDNQSQRRQTTVVDEQNYFSFNGLVGLHRYQNPVTSPFAGRSKDGKQDAIPRNAAPRCRPACPLAAWLTRSPNARRCMSSIEQIF